jgi:D-alanyl-D-alanine dipeptidase
MRPWSSLPIQENHEPLVALPEQLLRIEPHPYAALGAPYGLELSPFRLRQGVVDRLLQAQAILEQHQPEWQFAVFDAWRPVAVQAFMVDHAIGEECHRRGVDPMTDSPGRQAAVEDVGRFWAPPSESAATPPPHSTGGAVDLTLADAQGQELAMGGAIDAIGPISEPLHYAAMAQQQPDSQEAFWHGRRLALTEAMQAAGFAQHPNEWWHFSWGDQLWAWRTGAVQACYGRAPD